MIPFRSLSAIAPAVVGCLLISSCGESSGEGCSQGPPVALDSYRVDLLDLAFRASSKLPLSPHVKNRARLQDEVVQACLQLGDLERAERFAASIPNWRRGACQADVALAFAQRGESPRALALLEKAEAQIEELSAEENQQAWRAHRIRSKIARTYLELDRKDDARKFLEGVTDTDGKVIGEIRAAVVEEENFDAELKAIDQTLAVGTFEQARVVLTACALLFDRFYEDDVKRAALEERVRSGYRNLPGDIRIELLMKLADICLRRERTAHASKILEEAREQVRSIRWTPEMHVPLLANLTYRRHRAGEVEEAARDAEHARNVYDVHSEKIYDVFRAETLRPLAEAHHRMGNAERARELFDEVIAEGHRNPNGRPRAEDFVATCLSMALIGCKPSEETMRELERIEEGLGDPW